MWSKTEHCCKCLTADFFLLVHIILQIWEFGLTAPKNPLIWSLAHAYLLMFLFFYKTCILFWITQIAIHKLQMIKCDTSSLNHTSKLVQVWERGIRNVIILLWIIFIFMSLQCKECFIKCTFSVAYCLLKKLLLFQRWTSE